MSSTEQSNIRAPARIWMWLVGLTAIELVLAYRHVFAPRMMMLVLMALSAAKAGMIMNRFMHLGSERLTLVFSLLPPLIFVLALLFGFFPDAYRIVELGAH